MAPTHPIPIRFTADDHAVIDDLTARTGLTLPNVVRLALRALRDKLDAEEAGRKGAKRAGAKKGKQR